MTDTIKAMTLVIKSHRCRRCDRRLVDQSDLWAGLCNDDYRCAERVRAQKAAALTTTSTIGDEP